MPVDPALPFVPLRIAVLTVSDSRGPADDRSGDTLVARLGEAGHVLADRDLLPDDLDALVARLRVWVARPDVDVVITTGGTGVTGRDVTPEAVRAVIDKEIPGFGEAFRWVSWQKIGSSTIQSRALAGVADTTYVFALPGSTGAVKDAWDELLVHQLDSRHRPCNFATLLPRLGQRDGA